MTIEPMSEAELRALQRLSGDAEGRVIPGNFPKRPADPLAEDWTASSIPYGNWCDPHVPCPCPDSCAADQVCIARCQWLVDTPQNRIALRQLAITEVTPAANLERHTVDIDRQPMSVEDEWAHLRIRWTWIGVGLLIVSAAIVVGLAWWVVSRVKG